MKFVFDTTTLAAQFTIKCRILPVVALSAALATVPAAAESRFATGETASLNQTARLDFTIIVPAFISVESGARAKPGRPGGTKELWTVQTARVEEDVAPPLIPERIAARAITNAGTFAAEPQRLRNGAVLVALP